MSGFFSNLAARSYGGSTPLLRPRIRSFFEPVSEVNAPTIKQTEVEDELASSIGGSEPPGDTGKRGFTPPIDFPAIAQIAPDAHSDSREKGIGAHSGSLSDRRIDSALQNLDESHLASFPVVPALHTSSELHRTGTSEAAVDFQLKAQRELSVSSKSPEARPLEAAIDTDHLPNSSRSLPVTQIEPAPRWNEVRDRDVGVLLTPKPPARFAESILPTSESRQVAQGGPPGPDLERAQEPDVHVTIGRIEVRAELERERPATRSSASPVMSLDEYLRARVRRGGQ